VTECVHSLSAWSYLVLCMQIDSWLEFAALSLSCIKEFKDALEYLNQALGPTAFLVGHSLSIADFAVWAVLHGNAYTTLWFSIKKTDTHTHTQLFYGSLDSVWDNPGEPVPEETFTHSHLSWSSVIPYLLPPSNRIHGIPPVQFTCLTVFP